MGALTVGGNGNSAGGGVFINRRVIHGVQNLSGQFDSDVTIKLEFEPIQKRDGSGTFTPQVMLFGKFARDAAGRIEKWGSAFKVQLLLEKVAGWKGTIGEDGKIPDEALEALLGKECFTLSYPAWKKRDGNITNEKVTNTHMLVAGLQMWDSNQRKLVPGDAWLKENFERERAGGYVKDFRDESAEAPVEAEAAYAGNEPLI
jgi:hypothetical protein